MVIDLHYSYKGVSYMIEKGVKMAREKLPKYLTRKQIQDILEQPNRDVITGRRNFLMIMVMFDAGLRASELVDLKGEHLKLEDNAIEVENGKGGFDRIVDIRPHTSELLKSWLEEKPDSDYVFSKIQDRNQGKGSKLSTAYLREMVARYGEKAGIKQRVHPHMFRHSCAVYMLEDGFPITDVKQQLGHKNLSTTEVYLDIVNPEKKKRYNNREPITGDGDDD